MMFDENNNMTEAGFVISILIGLNLALIISLVSALSQ